MSLIKQHIFGFQIIFCTKFYYFYFPSPKISVSITMSIFQTVVLTEPVVQEHG